jgi:uncharacterized Zn-finger protein
MVRPHAPAGVEDRGADVLTRRSRAIMTEHVVPHFHNESGLVQIEIGAREFMCIGAKPPFDHPHVFLDLGEEDEIICPYCSTLYKHNATLDPHSAQPPECALVEDAA